jgi:Zn-dependent protease
MPKKQMGAFRLWLGMVIKDGVIRPDFKVQIQTELVPFCLCQARVCAIVTAMNLEFILDGLVTYLCFLPILTFHEYAHAWVAWKCGDDTARLLGRVTLNPLAHMDLLGTVLLPLAALFLGAAGSPLANFIIGWGKPVPVNIYNLRHRRRDDTLVSLAGPAMNIALAFGLMIAAKVGTLISSAMWFMVCYKLAQISLLLGFFNLLPVPPLDGSHVLKNLTGMSDELYVRISQYGFIIILVLINLRPVIFFLGGITYLTLVLMERLVGL